jgi:predicted AAA+ superfamily ATPase
MIRRDSIIDYFKEYEKIPSEIIPRELKVPLKSNFIISIIGPRRAGKTFYFFQLLKELKDSAYLNFEDSRLLGATYLDFRNIIRIFIELYGKEPENLLLDEVQNVKNWEIVVRELHDLKKHRIFLTGSSSKLLSKEISTKLRGRTLSFILLPFSFKEFLISKGKGMEKWMSKNEEAKLKKLLKEYLEFGGFPDVVLNEEKVKILREYFDLILFRDFIERHKIKNIEIARFLHSYVVQNFTNEISIKSLFDKAKFAGAKVSKETIYDYITRLEDTVFFFFLKRFSKKAHVRETWPKKIYLCDTGIVKVVKFSEEIGKMMENAVFLNLLRKSNINPLMEIFYLRDHKKEVDFIVKEGIKIKQLIQVTYASNKDEIEKKDVKSLVKASEELKCKELSFITWDYEDELRFHNRKIKYIPLFKWLLQ